MGIFFPELFHFLDDFLNFNSVLFGGNLIVDFFDLFLNDFDLFVDFFVIVFLDLDFFFELELCVKEFLIEFNAWSLIFFDAIVMFKFRIIEGPKLIEDIIKLELDAINFRDGMGLDLGDSVENIGMIGVDLWEVLIKNVIVFIKPTIEEREVVRKFDFWDGNDVDEFELVLGDGDRHVGKLKKWCL